MPCSREGPTRTKILDKCSKNGQLRRLIWSPGRTSPHPNMPLPTGRGFLFVAAPASLSLSGIGLTEVWLAGAKARTASCGSSKTTSSATFGCTTRVPKTPILDSLKPPRKERWHCFETFYPTFKESIQADELRNGVKITDWPATASRPRLSRSTAATVRVFGFPRRNL